MRQPDSARADQRRAHTEQMGVGASSVAVGRVWNQAGLVLLGHGSTLNPYSSEPVFQHARELKRRWLFAQVEVGFWKEQPAFHEALYSIEESEAYLVPLFTSEGYFTQEIIPREFRLAGPVTRRDGLRINLCKPVGTHRAMTHVLLSRIKDVLGKVAIDPQDTAILVIGHGTGLHDQSGRVVQEQADRLRQLGRFGQVAAVFMEQEPHVERWMEVTNRLNTVAVPFFISNGLHAVEDVPVLMGMSKGRVQAAQLFDRNPHIVNGRRVWYAPAIGTDPHIADVIVDLVREFDASFKGVTGLA